VTYNLGINVPVVLAITKTAAKLSRLLGRGGGHALPGLIAEKLDPHLAQKLVAELPKGVILVTGTNGKTTTTKLIAAALEATGERVLTNSTGSNLKRGVTSAVIGAAELNGRIDATVGLFEVDEASLRLVAPELMPRHIVVLNVFRDQLDRYGELDTTAALIGQGIAATKAHLYLNADDPLVASLAKYADDREQVSYFGIEGLPSREASAYQTADSDRCPVCHARLKFSRVFYGHIGHYRCPGGHFSRPQPDVAVVSVKHTDLEGTEFTVAVGSRRSEAKFGLPGTYNLCNALAALSLAAGVGLDLGLVAKSLETTEAAFGRAEKVELDGRTLYLLLIKNPASFTQVLETFLIGRPGLRVMMAVNDLDADGRDVSWLWDVPLEALEADKPRVITTGTRGADMALRLHYAGIESKRIDGFEPALDGLLATMPRGSMAYILPTYTAMLQIRKRLASRTQMQEVWK
jgi:lipid II isoglutaminyl synthase (glutamine-hydrolysing)